MRIHAEHLTNVTRKLVLQREGLYIVPVPVINLPLHLFSFVPVEYVLYEYQVPGATTCSGKNSFCSGFGVNVLRVQYRTYRSGVSLPDRVRNFEDPHVGHAWPGMSVLPVCLHASGRPLKNSKLTNKIRR